VIDTTWRFTVARA